MGYLPDGGIDSEATGVSADGSVIVGYSFFADYEAFRWTSDGGMERLWDVLLAEGVDPAADGWERLLAAQDISADGNTIVGQGTRNGNIEAFVAVIPVVPQPGDYNGNGLVEQADLDLVLLNWGQSFGGLPAQWVKERPSIGIVDQEELDRVLLNWGNTAAGLQAATAVPEPGSLVLLGASSILLLRRRAPGATQ